MQRKTQARDINFLLHFLRLVKRWLAHPAGAAETAIIAKKMLVLLA